MGYTIYALFVSAFAFIGRLLELWLLTIGSPFAFVSSTIHELDIHDWGWSSWLKRLIKAAFMAPGFMFFMYFIFLLIRSNIFSILVGKPTPGANDPAGVIKILLGICMPALLILTLLTKSVKLAKAGSGQFGEAIISYGKQIGGLVGGLAVGAATGGASMIGQATLGRAGAAINSSTKLTDIESAGGIRGWGAARLRDLGKYTGTASFDARGIKIGGKSLASTGLKVGDARKGGFIEARKEAEDKKVRRAEELKVHEDESLKVHLKALEEDKQKLLNEFSHSIETLDNRINVWRQRMKDRNDRVKILRDAKSNGDTSVKEEDIQAASAEAKEAADNLKALNEHKSAIKNGKKYTVTNKAALLEGQELDHEIDYEDLATREVIDPETGQAMIDEETGEVLKASINKFEDDLIPHAHHAVVHKEKERRMNYAKALQKESSKLIGFITSGGAYTSAAAREASHKIIMEVKVEGKKKGGGGHAEAHPPTGGHAAGGHAAGGHPEAKAEGGGHGHDAPAAGGDKGGGAGGEHH